MSADLRWFHVLFVALIGVGAFPAKSSPKLPYWYGLPDISLVEEQVQKRISEELGGGASSEFKVHRIGASNLYYVVVGEKVYITDSVASYWIESADMSIKQLSEGFRSASLTQKSQQSLVGSISFLRTIKNSMIIYPSESTETKKIIYVLMDLNCPHSRDFHLRDRHKVQGMGYELRYVPVIFLNKGNAATDNTTRIWCAGDQGERRTLIDSWYINGKSQKLNDVDTKACTPIDTAYLNYMLSIFDVNSLSGTPVFLTESGSVYYGSEAILSAIAHWPK